MLTMQDQTAVRRLTPRLAALAVALVCLAPAAPGAVAAASPVFGYTETRKKDLKAFPKWTKTLDRYAREKGKTRAEFKTWVSFLDGVKGETDIRKLNKVNNFHNKTRYIMDPVNWGKKDYWATPKEFFSRNGDCEDYAISKYISLRAIGWPKDKLRILVVKDMNLQFPHAILMVEHDGKWLILDNQITIVADAAKIRHYKPIFSVNEITWWRHTPKGASKIRKGKRTKRRSRSKKRFKLTKRRKS